MESKSAQLILKKAEKEKRGTDGTNRKQIITQKFKPNHTNNIKSKCSEHPHL